MSRRQAETSRLQASRAAWDLERSEVMVKLQQVRELKRIYEQKISDLEARIRAADRSINQMTTELTITEHAQLRWLERVHKVDFAALRAEILSEKTRDILATVGNGEIKLPVPGVGQVKFVVRDNRIITVCPEDP